ncbi:ferroxidase fet3, partial [Candidozyma auris]
MDGPEHVTQCPIPPGHTFTYNFTVDDQAGTYWYHSHSGSQYSDGLRGMFIIEEESRDLYPFTFDEEVPLTVCDWYHAQSSDIMSQFLSRYNPTGAEPIPQNSLFNDTRNVTWNVEPDKTYFLRIVNMGMFVPANNLYIENHTFTIVEVD